MQAAAGAKHSLNGLMVFAQNALHAGAKLSFEIPQAAGLTLAGGYFREAAAAAAAAPYVCKEGALEGCKQVGSECNGCAGHHHRAKHSASGCRAASHLHSMQAFSPTHLEAATTCMHLS